MSDVLSRRVAALRVRLDALPALRPASAGARAWYRLGAARSVPRLEVLGATVSTLDAIGIHTSADARLLAEVAKTDERRDVSRRLMRDAGRALGELEDAVGSLERAARAGRPVPGAALAMEEPFRQAARVVRTAELLAAPRADPTEDFELFERRADASTGPRPPREELVAAWAERARTDWTNLAEQRRLLDRAHQLLVRQATGEEERSPSLSRLRVEVALRRERLRALEGSATAAAALAAAERCPERAYRPARALYELAAEAGATGPARALLGALAPLMPFASPAELDPELADLALGLGAEQRELFELAQGCAAFFDVEDALATDEALGERPRLEVVPYPTERMTFAYAEGLHQLGDFVLSDPRRIVYDLAAGQQLARVHLEERAPRSRKARRTAVRVYVCDASGSMRGHRAKFRDALLVAELEDLRRRARAGRPFVPLYYAYFTDTASALARVDGPDAAVRHLGRLLEHQPAQGRTDITLALISAFDAIRAAHGRDAYLSRATVVLVTDGEDQVEREVIDRLRAPLGRMEISLSFISLGGRNRDLEEVVRAQREAGSRAFYQHLSDAELTSVKTDFDRGRRTVLPAQVALTPALADELRQRLRLIAPDALKPRPARIRKELGFDAFFPEPPRAPAPDAGPKSEAQRRAAQWVLAVAEAAALVPMRERPGESVALIEHLLQVYGVPVADFLERTASPSEPLAAALRRLRRVGRAVA